MNLRFWRSLPQLRWPVAPAADRYARQYTDEERSAYKLEPKEPASRAALNDLKRRTRALEQRVAALEETHSRWLSEHEKRLVAQETFYPIPGTPATDSLPDTETPEGQQSTKSISSPSSSVSPDGR